MQQIRERFPSARFFGLPCSEITHLRSRRNQLSAAAPNELSCSSLRCRCCLSKFTLSFSFRQP